MTRAESCHLTPPPVPAWQAQLSLRFAGRDGQTLAIERRHHGPLRVQKMLYPQGPSCCHGLLLHPPGGIAGGDQLAIDIRLDDAAHVLLTTPGASKWYRSVYADARQTIRLTVQDHSCLEWLPQETLLFQGARAQQSLSVELSAESRWFGWDIVQLGRLAADEAWSQGHWAQTVHIYRQQRLIWHESAAFAADAAIRHSPLGLADHAVFATLWISGPQLSADPQAALQAARSIEAPMQVRHAASWLGDTSQLLVIRVLAHDASRLRAYCESVWLAMRPWICALPAQRPRIWNT